MASSRVFAICVLLQLGVAIHGSSFNVGYPFRTMASVAESTINSAQKGLQMVELKLHIDQRIDYLWTKFQSMLESVLEEKRASCGKEVQYDISALKEALSNVPEERECMDLKNIHDDIKTILHGQEQVSERLANVSRSREVKVDRLEHQLRETSLMPEVFLYNPDGKENGSFYVKTSSAFNRLYGDGWIVFQQRYDGTIDFYRNWTDYRDGFGELGGEFWLGLEKLHRIVSSGPSYELLVELEDFQGVTAFEHYHDFLIGDERENYALKHLGKGIGTAGDAMVLHRGMNFSTYDRKTNDCPTFYHGAWWFRQCYDAHLNGEYLVGKQTTRGGIIWHTFRGSFESLQATKMMIRPLPKIDHGGQPRLGNKFVLPV